MDIPYLFLDVDAVIGPSEEEPGVSAHFAAQVRKRLNCFHESGLVHIEWLTSWEAFLTSHLVSVLGLPQWPVHTRESAPWDECPIDTDWWKQRVVFAYLELGRRVIWCDGETGYRADRATLGRLYGDRLLMVAPTPGTGLSADELDAIERWAIGAEALASTT